MFPQFSCESLLSMSHVYHFHINHNLDKNDQENHIQTFYSLTRRLHKTPATGVSYQDYYKSDTILQGNKIRLQICLFVQIHVF